MRRHHFEIGVRFAAPDPVYMGRIVKTNDTKILPN